MSNYHSDFAGEQIDEAIDTVRSKESTWDAKASKTEDLDNLKFRLVEELPPTPESDVVYLIKEL